MILSDERILGRVQTIIAEVLRIPVAEVTPDSLVGQDLGAESLDFVDIQFRLETEYGVRFYQGSALEKLTDLLAPLKLEENGLLTSLGAALFRLRLPEVNPARLEEGQPAAGIEALYTPRTWVRVVKELLAARPSACPKCDSDRLKVVKPSLLLCESCQTEIHCPGGEECLEAWASKMAESVAGLQRSSGR